jgi:stress-induced morphogen
MGMMSNICSKQHKYIMSLINDLLSTLRALQLKIVGKACEWGHTEFKR